MVSTTVMPSGTVPSNATWMSQEPLACRSGAKRDPVQYCDPVKHCFPVKDRYPVRLFYPVKPRDPVKYRNPGAIGGS